MSPIPAWTGDMYPGYMSPFFSQVGGLDSRLKLRFWSPGRSPDIIAFFGSGAPRKKGDTHLKDIDLQGHVPEILAARPPEKGQ